jgi:peptidoglycan/LPS O-acetylase OafA/YrhL
MVVLFHVCLYYRQDLSILGFLAVDSFFVLSGYFCMASYSRSKSIWDYLGKRVKRIFPAFWVCLFVSVFALFPLTFWVRYDEFPMSFEWMNALNYFRNLGLVIVNPSIPNLPIEGGFNASLWSIAWEFGGYIIVALLGMFSVKKRDVKLLAIAVNGVYIAISLSSGNLTISPILAPWYLIALRCFSFLLVGISAYCFSFKTRKTDWVFIPVVAGLAAFNLECLFPIPLLLALFWLGHHLPFKGLKEDYSYGVYLYHLPLVYLFFSAELPVWWAIVPTVGLAWFSWHFVESQQKSRIFLREKHN